MRVRPGVDETRARLRVPARAFSRLLLPTLERPRNATSGSPSRGNCAADPALTANVTAGLRIGGSLLQSSDSSTEPRRHAERKLRASVSVPSR